MTPTLFSDAGGPWLIAFIVLPIVAGVLAFIGLAIGGYWYVKRRRRRAQQLAEQHNAEPPL